MWTSLRSFLTLQLKVPASYLPLHFSVPTLYGAYSSKFGNMQMITWYLPTFSGAEEWDHLHYLAAYLTDQNHMHQFDNLMAKNPPTFFPHFLLGAKYKECNMSDLGFYPTWHWFANNTEQWILKQGMLFTGWYYRLDYKLHILSQQLFLFGLSCGLSWGVMSPPLSCCAWQGNDYYTPCDT